MSALPHAIGELQRLGELLRTSAVRIEIVRGRARQRVRPVIVPVFLIGSGSECDLVLADEEFPRVHSHLCLAEESVSIRHLGEGPPMWVGRSQVTSAELRDGDIIQLSSYQFKMHVNPSSSTPMLFPEFFAKQTNGSHGPAPLRLYIEPELAREG